MKTNFIRENKILKNGFKFFLYVFSVVGVVLTTGFFAVKLGITNDPGTVDRNDRYLADISDDNYSYLNEAEKGKDSLFIANKKSAYILYKIGIINKF